MTELLRLRRSAEPIWRDVASLQFGLGASAPRLLEPSPAELRLIDALVDGFPDAALDSVANAAGLDVTRAAQIVSALASAMERRPRSISVVVHALVNDITERCFEVVADALSARGYPTSVELCEGVDATSRTPRPDVTVLVIGELCTPRDAAPWLRDDAAHLPFVLRDEEITVGPLIVPGATACVACDAAHAKQRDAAWPFVMSQLAGRPTPDAPMCLVAEAGALAATLIADVATLRRDVTASADDPRRTAPATRSVTVSLDAPRRWRSHRPHSACTCLGLEPFDLDACDGVDAGMDRADAGVSATACRSR